MPMGSQFSLSLELTKLVPFGSLVNAAGHGFVRLLREIQSSGSDFITEQDLAEVFGRNRLEPLFASTFRTAIKHSVIHHISGIADLVLEGGAGPTVRRSLNETAYLAMVVQLSLLTYTHELNSLTAGLIKAFERRNQGSVEYVALPHYDALKGALRAIREQTCGFMWELVISAVEQRLYPSIAWTDGSLYTVRAIPQVVLQALLDSFTAIQHLPEHTHLEIQSFNGLPTIVVWAHRILGLTVEVSINDQRRIFGDGPVTVYIDGDHNGPPGVALLNETNDPFFQLLEQRQDHTLAPAPRHPVRDYGTRVLRLRNDDHELERKKIYLIVTSCITVARNHNRDRSRGTPEPGGLSSFPTLSRVLLVLRLLFASCEEIIDDIDLESELPCVAHMPERPSTAQQSQIETQFDSNLYRLFQGEHKTILRLIHVVFVLSMARNFEEDLSLHIDPLEEAQYMPFEVPSARSAFASLAALLQGRFPRTGDSDVTNKSVVSAWGWSLYLSSLASQDPSDAKVDIALVRGVPARRGERRHYVVDGALSLRQEVLSGQISGDSYFDAVHGPGDRCVLSSWLRAKERRYFIGVTDDAFEVVNVLEYDALRALRPSLDANSVSCGFRSMQETSWQVFHTPACDHSAALGQSIALPDDVWAFHGFGRPTYQDYPPTAVFAGLVAGDHSARWILTAMMLHQWRAGTTKKQIVCLRSRDCCFECAIQFAKSCHRGDPVGLVL
ncbi:MAG: hypothetical protein LQ338_003264 [Usnochroma carphineum]|nr:MAG: hypothetical protein LQ338_003264 [Usnochroma carphineum]